jgi:hypothetical protein
VILVTEESFTKIFRINGCFFFFLKENLNKKYEFVLPFQKKALPLSRQIQISS